MAAGKVDIFQVIEILEGMFQGHARPIPLHTPDIGPGDKSEVCDCLESGWVSYLGDHLNRFEQHLSRVCQSPGAVALVSGTAALHLALLSAGVKPDDEVLMPPLSFVATANAAAYIGAIPHFVDIEPETLGVCPTALKSHLSQVATPDHGGLRNRQTGRRIKALIAVHLFGHPADLDALSAICQEHGIALVEDAAESLGSTYKGRPVGNHGLVSALSFNGNKIITTGGGGALLSNTPAMIERTRHISSTAKMPHPWESRHDQLGYNYRMPALNAALGISQLKRLDEFVESKRALARRYAEAFDSLAGVRFLREPMNSRSNYWLNTIILGDSLLVEREQLLQYATQAGFLVRPAWELLCDLPFYNTCPRSSLDNARDLQPRIVNLPSSAGWVCPKQKGKSL